GPGETPRPRRRQSDGHTARACHITKLRRYDRHFDDAAGHIPLGCQTVLVSVKARIASRDWVFSQSPSLSPAGRRTRLRFSAASASSSPQVMPSAPAAPASSIAFTSRCFAKCGATSAVFPVSTFTTPPGTSEVESTSESVIAGSGRSCEDSRTTAFPDTITGASTDTSPSSEEPCGASTATTPVGSGTEMLKYGPATGLAFPATWATLSDQPAYQTHRSMAAETSCAALRAETPSPAATSATTRPPPPSSSSATRYSTWPRL